MEPRRINEAGRRLIESFEGLRVDAYQDQGGVWTIGYGHTRGVTREMVVNQAQAESLLANDLDHAERAVSQFMARCGYMPTDNQFAALVSLVFNVGTVCLNSHLTHMLIGEHPMPALVPDWIELWNKVRVDGREVVSPGLARRRSAEAQLWQTPDTQGGVS